jgi:hypothetical protein
MTTAPKPHWEAVVLAIERKESALLVKYLRRSEGIIHPKIVAALSKAEFRFIDPRLKGGKLSRFNRLAADLPQTMFRNMMALDGRVGVDFAMHLADLLDGDVGKKQRTQMKMVRPKSSRGRPKMANQGSEFRIAQFLVRHVSVNGRLPETAIYAACDRFGGTRATIRSIWARNKSDALLARILHARLRRKRFRPVKKHKLRITLNPDFRD